MAKQRAFLKYLGGKYTMRSKIIEMLPKCRLYRSVFLGSGGVEFSIDPAGKSEIWNDYDKGLANLYRVIQDETSFNKFRELCSKTLFSESEFQDSKTYLSLPMEHFGDSVYAAWKYYVRNRMSRMGDRTSFAVPTSRLRKGISENVSSWNSAVDGLEFFHKRLKCVEIRQMAFQYFITKFDHEDCVFLCDPPYLSATRVGGKYEVEMSEQDHINLLELLSGIKGKFLLHGLPSPLYFQYAQANNWKTTVFETKKSSSSKEEKPISLETVWTNY